MATFKVRVACELRGSKHNAMFLFRPPPGSLDEVVAEAERFYGPVASGAGCAPFKVAALQVHADGVWRDVDRPEQLTDGCQLFAFTADADARPAEASPAVPAAPLAPASAIQPPRSATSPLPGGDREAAAFDAIDSKNDGVIDETELRAALEPLRFTAAQIGDLFVVADDDGDGVVSRIDFARFAARFPTVVDAVNSQSALRQAAAESDSALRGAEEDLQRLRLHEQEIERQLYEQRRVVAQLVSDVADRRAAQAAQLLRRPQVEAQQRRLVAEEFALAAQREQLRAEEDKLRQSVWRPADTTAPVPAAVVASAPAAAAAARRDSGADSRTTSFFLPSPASSLPPPAGEEESLPMTPMAAPTGAPAATQTVEVCGFTMRPELNGLKGVALKWEGNAVTVRFGGGATIDLPRHFLRPAAGEDHPPAPPVTPQPPPLSAPPAETEVTALKAELRRVRQELEAEKAKRVEPPVSPERRAALARLAGGSQPAPTPVLSAGPLATNDSSVFAPRSRAGARSISPMRPSLRPPPTPAPALSRPPSAAAAPLSLHPSTSATPYALPPIDPLSL